MKKFKFLYIAAAALLFAACANEEDGIGNNGPVAASNGVAVYRLRLRAGRSKGLEYCDHYDYNDHHFWINVLYPECEN